MLAITVSAPVSASKADASTKSDSNGAGGFTAFLNAITSTSAPDTNDNASQTVSQKQDDTQNDADNTQQRNVPTTAPAAEAEKIADPKERAAATDDTAPVKAPVRSAGADTNASDEEASDKVRAELQAQLQTIDQIVLAIIQALAGNKPLPQPDTVAAATTPAVATPAVTPAITPGATSAANLQTPLTEGALAATLPATPSDFLITASSPATSPQPTSAATTSAQDIQADAASVLKDIRALLAGVQQAVAPQAPVSQSTAAPSESLDSLTQGIQEKLQQLTALLTQAAPATPAPQIQAAATVPSAPAPLAPEKAGAPALLQALKNGIETAQEKLSQLASRNDSAATQNGQEIRSAFLSLTAFFQPVKSDTQALADTAPTSAAPVTIAAAAAATVTQEQTVKSAVPQAAPLESLAANATASTLLRDAVKQNDTPADTNTGSNQNPSPALALAPHQPAHNSTSSSVSDFSRFLQPGQNAPVSEQVAFQIKNSGFDGSSKIQIQLSPAELGGVEIKLHVKADGKTDVVVTADNRSTLDMLQRDSQNLARALGDAGLTTDGGSLNFNLRQGQQEQPQGERAQAAMHYQKSQPEEDVVPQVRMTTRNYVLNMAEGLDISI